MAITGSDLRLGGDELAFYFQTDGGLDAALLGDFLRRAAALAATKGAALKIIDTRPGSLAIIARVKRTANKFAKSARREFSASPIATTSALASAVVAVLAASSSMATPESDSLAKAGAKLVERHEVVSIEIVTNDVTLIMMDRNIAQKFKHDLQQRKLERTQSVSSAIQAVQGAALIGKLDGVVLIVNDVPHFRPDGHRFLVPVTGPSAQDLHWEHNRHYRVKGMLYSSEGQPDLLQVESVGQT